MAASVEARVPFCHYRLFLDVNRLDPSLKVEHGETKYLLKRIAQRYLPSELIYRRKNGFNLPLDEWLRDETSLGRFLDMLTDTTARGRGIYHGARLARVIDEHRRRRADHTLLLTQLITLELWHRQCL